ncbi:hypothetical protein IG631_11432 [Alternaria alternata]|nr:hypothetical protein IG631_11432 [Alternaria alternata]
MFELLDRDNGHSSERRPLSRMLDLAQHFEKTEAGDSVYAILGLIDRDKALGDNEAALLEVNYMKSLPDVLRDATRYALCEDDNLQALRDINHQVEMLADYQTFPTWTARADLQHLPQDAHWLPDQYRAYEGLEAPSLLSDVSFDKNVLLLQGIVVDQAVQTTAVCCYDTLVHNEEYHQWLGSVKDMTMNHRNITMQENIDPAIASTLVAGKAKSGEEAQPDDLKVLVEYIKSLAIREDGIVSDGVNIRPPVNMEKMIATFDTVHVHWCKDRRFFVTAAGYMGLGPRCMQPEDIVVVLRGGLSPFILRKKADGYWLIGETYVHGIMYGEAVQMDRSRGGSEMVFHVR